MMIGVEPSPGASNEEMLAWDINNVLLNNGAPMLGVEPSPAASNFEMLLWDILQNSGGGGGPGTQVQSDWAQTNNTQVDFIKNKPTIPAAQVQSDWNQTNPASIDFIKNKPGVYSDTYANWALAIENSELPVGYYINITDADNCDLGLVLFCPKANQVSIQGVGLFLNADYQKNGNYSGVLSLTGIDAGDLYNMWFVDEVGGYVEGDIVIWKNQHYQLTDEGEIDLNPPDINNLAYTLLPRNLENMGYIESADIVEYDFPNNYIQKRLDNKGNEISLSWDAYQFLNAIEPKPIFQFTWGKNEAYSNYANQSYFSNYDFQGRFSQNYAIVFSSISEIIAGPDSRIEGNYLNNQARIAGVEIVNGAHLSNNNVVNGQKIQFTDLNGYSVNNNLLQVRVTGSIDISLPEISCDIILDIVGPSGATAGTVNSIDIGSNRVTIITSTGLSVTLTGTAYVSANPSSLVMESATYPVNGARNPNAVFVRKNNINLFLDLENLYL